MVGFCWSEKDCVGVSDNTGWVEKGYFRSGSGYNKESRVRVGYRRL